MTGDFECISLTPISAGLRRWTFGEFRIANRDPEERPLATLTMCIDAEEAGRFRRGAFYRFTLSPDTEVDKNLAIQSGKLWVNSEPPPTPGAVREAEP